MRPAHPPHRVPTCGAARLAALLALAAALLPALDTRADEGPVPANVESAVDRGLVWLAKNQDRTSGGFPPVAQRAEYPSVAVTSLAAMAFMARGHTPGQGPYGDNLNRAIDYVLKQQKPNGILAASLTGNNTMYEHGIATVMLCEAYGMLDDKRQEQARGAIARAVRVILAAQRVPKDSGSAGGWRYQPNQSSSDISVTGWQLMALRGAANVGADIPQRSLDAGIAYIKRRATSSGGFTYTSSESSGGGPNPARTGTGVLALELLGQHGAKESIAGGEYLLTHPVGSSGNEHYFYTVYYCSQAAWQLGGKYWDLIAPAIRNSLIQNQRTDGSWATSGTNEQQGGAAYGTAMAVLSLSVPYRYLPIYQR
jgi:hypothetical protein